MSDFAYPLHEECGVFGIYDRAGTEDVAAAAYSALYALQHRGQESCGIAVNDDGVITGHRDLGLVNEVFTPEVLASLSTTTAHMATGHVRYATAGTRVRANAQPMIVRHGRGTMALCHNGNLTNAVELRRQLENEGAIFHGSSDTEVICYLITRNRLRMGSIETAISKTMDVLEGAYSLVIMSATKLIAVRDPRGYRPLCIGTLPGGGYVFASESCALDATGASLLRDAGAAEVHFMVSAPPFKYPCYFGTDIPDQKLLVATGRTLEQINEVIGADTLGYLSNEHVVQLAKNAKCGFCTACFTGEYAVEPESVLSTDIHDRHLTDRPKDAKKLGE